MSIIIDTPTRISRVRGALVPSYLVSGSQTIDPGYMLAEDGTRILDESGDPILLESPTYILNEDSSYQLDEDGHRILTEDSSPAGGTATPLLRVSTPALSVTVAAKSNNFNTIWISGSDVAEGIGIPLYPTEDNVYIPIDDVSKVYIYGDVGDGVTFFYGTTVSPTDNFVRDDDGTIIVDDSGNQVITE